MLTADEKYESQESPNQSVFLSPATQNQKEIMSYKIIFLY